MSGTRDLEAQLAFVEDALQTLDAAMASQQQQILRLEQQIDVLQQRLKEQGHRLDSIAEPDAEPPPPHY
ncbi:MAG: SlyX family protein [Proteobacteria bacterium]|nr:SlyX family protein [Pseudomonadota bacterium]